MPTLSFHSITVSVPDIKGARRYLPAACVSNANRREVLHSISGKFPQKGIVAIMGPSGSGKTTFLNAVSNRMAIGGSSGVKCSGAVRVNGREVDPEFFYSKSVSFVPQDTCLFAELTPREAIRFSTTLVYPTMSAPAVEANVNSTLAAMGLGKCADTPVGNEMFRGVSGGERKRTSIGVNIVNNPSVLFLDEPTTGLDTETAAMVVRSIQNISGSRPSTNASSSSSSSSGSSSSSSSITSTAPPSSAASTADSEEDGRIVIMTLHQPSSDIWDMIDHLVILAQGYVVYNGPAKDAMDFFVSIGFRRPTHINPADYFLDIVQCEEDDDDASAASASVAAAAAVPQMPALPGSSAAATAAAAAAASAAVVARTKGSKKQRAKFLATAWRHHEKLRRAPPPIPSSNNNNISSSTGAGIGSATLSVTSAAAPGRGAASVGALMGWDNGRSGNAVTNSSSSSSSSSAVGGGSVTNVVKDARRAKLEEMVRKYNERMQQQAEDNGDALDEEEDDGGYGYDEAAAPNGSSLAPYGSALSTPAQAVKGTWSHELKTLTARSWKTFSRTRLMIPMKLVQIFITAVLIIGLFSPFGFDQISVLNRTGCMYLVIIVQIFATVLSVVMLFPAERGVYLNEQAQRLYSVSSYFVSKLIIDLPILTLTIFGFCLLVYFPVGFQSDFARFLRFFFVLEGVAICGHAMGLIVAACVASPAIAALLAPMAIAPFILFSHIAIPGDPDAKIIGILRPFQIFSPFWWGLDALAVTEFAGLKLHCTDDQVYAVPSVEHGLLYMCRFVLGEEVLMSYSIHLGAFAPSLVYLFLIATMHVVMSGVLLKVLSLRVAKCVPMEPPQAAVSAPRLVRK